MKLYVFKSYAKQALGWILFLVNFKLIRRNSFDSMMIEISQAKAIKDTNQILQKIYPKISKLFESKSQNGQDIFVLEVLGFTELGFFVEIGAADGAKNSNTYLLENEFGWNGICIEPGIFYRESLVQNRNCIIDFRCVYSKSGEMLTFLDSVVHELSTIKGYENLDNHIKVRENNSQYKVQSVSLNDLLIEYDAPKTVDYISLDTEGSELDILEAFDFENWCVLVWTIEHNFTKNRSAIFSLMKSKGYKRVRDDISDYDDWYIKETLVQEFSGKYKD